MRILITGSRDWDDWETIWNVLKNIEGSEHTLVSGACPTGADKYCEQYARMREWGVERHPANWRRYGKSAGFKRNNHMALLGADVCYAFIKNESKGSTMMARLAVQQSIPTEIVLSKEERELGHG